MWQYVHFFGDVDVGCLEIFKCTTETTGKTEIHSDRPAVLKQDERKTKLSPLLRL